MSPARSSSRRRRPSVPRKEPLPWGSLLVAAATSAAAGTGLVFASEALSYGACGRGSSYLDGLLSLMPVGGDVTKVYALAVLVGLLSAGGPFAVWAFRRPVRAPAARAAVDRP